MKKFYKEYKLSLWIMIIGVPILYCLIMSMGRSAAKLGCQSSIYFDGSYEAYVYCNRKADAITWGWKSDFEGKGKTYTFDKDAEVYIIKGEEK